MHLDYTFLLFYISIHTTRNIAKLHDIVQKLLLLDGNWSFNINHPVPIFEEETNFKT